jgi:hypothetical protein
LVFDKVRGGHQLAKLYSGNSLSNYEISLVSHIGNISEDKEYADDGIIIDEPND